MHALIYLSIDRSIDRLLACLLGCSRRQHLQAGRREWRRHRILHLDHINRIRLTEAVPMWGMDCRSYLQSQLQHGGRSLYAGLRYASSINFNNNLERCTQHPFSPKPVPSEIYLSTTTTLRKLCPTPEEVLETQWDRLHSVFAYTPAVSTSSPLLT